MGDNASVGTKGLVNRHQYLLHRCVDLENELKDKKGRLDILEKKCKKLAEKNDWTAKQFNPIRKENERLKAESRKFKE